MPLKGQRRFLARPAFTDASRLTIIHCEHCSRGPRKGGGVVALQAENQVVTFLATAKKQSDGAKDAPMAKVQALTKRIEEAEDAAPPLKKKKLMTMEEMRAIQRRIDEEEEAQK